MIQIREKDLADRDLLALVETAVEIAANSRTRILVNDRLDIALAANAHGVHVGVHSAPITAVRSVAPEDFVVGASTHNMREAKAAADGGADLITFGPVFFTPSKARYGPPVGIEALEEVCMQVKTDVFPLGGINEKNFPQLLHLPVAGLAAISLFQGARNLGATVRMVRNKAGGVG